MAMRKPIPAPEVPLVDLATGRMTLPWLEYFRVNDALGIAALSNVSSTAPADGEVLIYSLATGKWTPGAN
jgi:hypothetical protein